MTDPLPIDLPVTGIAFILNMLLFLALTVNVVRLRRRGGVVLGDNGDRVLQKAIRAQGNAAEQMPLTLLGLALAELGGAPTGLLILSAAVFTLGRVAHGAYFGWHGLPWRLRFWGMWATFGGQALMMLALVWSLL